METNKQKDYAGLLDELGGRLHCSYLSDLKKERLRDELLKAVAEIPAGRYSFWEWADALHYLTGILQADQVPVEAVRANLLSLLLHGTAAAIR